MALEYSRSVPAVRRRPGRGAGWLPAALVATWLSAPAAFSRSRADGGRAGPAGERGRRVPRRRRDEATRPVRNGGCHRVAGRISAPDGSGGHRGAHGRGTRFGGRAHVCRPLRRHSGPRHSGERPPDHRIAEHPRFRRPAGSRAPGRGTAELQRRARREILHRSGPPPARRSPARSQLGRLRQRSPRRSGVAHHPERA